MHHLGIFTSTDTGGYGDAISNGEQEEFKPGKLGTYLQKHSLHSNVAYGLVNSSSALKFQLRVGSRALGREQRVTICSGFSKSNRSIPEERAQRNCQWWYLEAFNHSAFNKPTGVPLIQS
ncbi:hypothetical protein AV530_014888 [Patagioenas fasciata monilis]|uniref:Uncharacterized protein n=1 Tax=Patagioenas fasciata monilis TaxID=372326 RepID=A0A1V4K6F0_PATFA|nr:hypothetical protein AV530_014888 [Patagioenas fasciata monilis]